MTKKTVQNLLEDIRLVSAQNFEVIEAVSALVKNTFESTSEEVKYAAFCSHQAFSLMVSSPTKHASPSKPVGG
jgi:hypothetical protein